MTRRQQILEVARELFLDSGADGVTMRAVAARVGISAPGIYKHFASKDALLNEVVKAGRDRFTTFLVRSLSGATPRERLVATGESYLDFAFEHPRDYHVMFMAWEKVDPRAHGDIHQGEHTQTFQMLMDRVRECLPGDQASDPQMVFEHALLFWSQAHGLATLYLSGGARHLMPLAAYRALCQRSLARLVDGVLARDGLTKGGEHD